MVSTVLSALSTRPSAHSPDDAQCIGGAREANGRQCRSQVGLHFQPPTSVGNDTRYVQAPSGSFVIYDGAQKSHQDQRQKRSLPTNIKTDTQEHITPAPIMLTVTCTVMRI